MKTRQIPSCLLDLQLGNAVVAAKQANDDCLPAAIQEKISDGIAQGIINMQASEDALKISEIEDFSGFILRTASALPIKAVMEVETPVMVRTPLGISSIYIPG